MDLVGSEESPNGVVRRTVQPMLVRAMACAPAALLAGAGIAASPSARRTNALTYVDSIHSTRGLDHALRVVTFHACAKHSAGSDADGRPVTFWSGFILASAPRRLHLKIWVDGASRPRRAGIPIGRRC
jgi:hypothetical protein